MVIVINNKMSNMEEDLSKVKVEACSQGVLLNLSDLKGMSFNF